MHNHNENNHLRLHNPHLYHHIHLVYLYYDQITHRPDYSNESSFLGQFSTESTLLVPSTVWRQGVVNLVVLVILVTQTEFQAQRTSPNLWKVHLFSPLATP